MVDRIDVHGAVGCHSTVIEGEKSDAANEATGGTELGRILLEDEIGARSIGAKQLRDPRLEPNQGIDGLADLSQLSIERVNGGLELRQQPG